MVYASGASVPEAQSSGEDPAEPVLAAALGADHWRTGGYVTWGNLGGGGRRGRGTGGGPGAAHRGLAGLTVLMRSRRAQHGYLAARLRGSGSRVSSSCSWPQ